MSSPAPELIELVRAQSPELIAVQAADATLTYAELVEQAARIAELLPDSQGSLVGLCLPRSAALVVATYAILAAGTTYVALDPSQPVARLRGLLAEAGVPVVLTTPELAGALGDESPVAVPGVGVLARLAPDPPTVVEPGLAYVMFTSGSTGTPKGVMVERTSLAGLAAWHRETFAVRPGDRCSMVAGPGFDAAAWEIWGALTAGASLVPPPEALKTDPAALRDWLVDEQIAVSFLPTPLAEAVLALEWPSATTLRVLLTGGDRLHRSPRADLPFVLHNNYGVTEATVVATSGIVRPDAAGLPSIGHPIAGVDVLVVTEDAGDGPGELLLGGPLLARGYLNAPELTASRFVELAGSRWYRTGDLVETSATGDLTYLGRLDQQVQVRGNRIEPGEIEAALERHPSVVAAVVLAEGDGVEGPRLVAYLTGTEPESAAELAAHLSEILPVAMHPSRSVWLDAFPMTPNGKVDRAALGSVIPVQAVGRVPADELEGAVAELVAELLGLPSVAADDDFLLLGGHSLLGAQVVTRLADHYGVEVSLLALFDAPTPAGMAAEVRRLLIEQVQELDDETATQLAAEAR